MRNYGIHFKHNLFLLCFCIFVSIFFVLLLSPTTSCIYQYPVPMKDGAIFFIIGRYWVEGVALPYVDLWDLKGPIIFLINGLGYLLSHNMKGVSVFQIICLGFTLYYTFRLLSLRYSFKESVVLSIGVLLCLSLTYESGNNCEEYLLPFLVLSYYGFFKWIDGYSEIHPEHQPKYAFVYGFVLGFSLCIRLTNALGCMGGVVFIFLILLWKKQWKNLVYNTFTFLGGFLLITLPFIIYFGMKGALYEMWTGTFLYNLEYLGNSSMEFPFARLCTVYIFSMLLMLYGIYISLIKKKNVRGLFWVSSCVLLIVWLYNSNGYAHYGNLCYPCLCIFVTECASYLHEKKDKIRLFVSCLMFLGIVLFSIRLLRTVEYSKGYDNSGYDKLLSQIPLSDYDNISLYNCPPDIYYYYHIKPNVPYFSLQDFGCKRISVLEKRIFDAFERVDSKWILFRGGEYSIIFPLLKSKYAIYGMKDGYVLFIHK